MSAEFRFDVFLSHSVKDKPVVRKLAARLKNDRVRVWLDEEQIRPGDNILAKIEEGLEHSRVLMLCMSANAFGSDWAQLEAGTFRFRDPLNKNRRLIPLRLDGAPIKGSLSQFLYIDWKAADRQQEYAKLLDACRPPQAQTMATPEHLAGIGEAAGSRWTFRDLPDHRTLAYHRRLCEQYAGFGSFDVLELCNTWRRLAAEFTNDACISGRHGANVIHDPQVDKITRLLETACAARNLPGIDRLGRCLRRPDDEHLHYALALLDELEARLRAEAVSESGVTPPEFLLEGVDIRGGDGGVGDGGSARAKGGAGQTVRMTGGSIVGGSGGRGGGKGGDAILEGGDGCSVVPAPGAPPPPSAGCCERPRREGRDSIMLSGAKSSSHNLESAATRDEIDPDFHRRFMEMAVEEARKCEPQDSRVHPRVGAVVVKGGVVLARAYRSELVEGDHAEYTALEKKLCDVAVAGATVYTTLEPCTSRSASKVPCVDRLIERKVKRVVIGMPDPNRVVYGVGWARLRDANIATDNFHDDLKQQIEEMNRDFIRYYKNGSATTRDGEKALCSMTPTEAEELDPIELACRSACGCAAGVDELRNVWDCEVNTPEEFVHFLGIAATVLRLVYHLKRAKDLFPPVANIVRAVRPEPPAAISGVPPGASYHDMAITKAKKTLWCFAPDAHCGREVLDSISSAAPIVSPAELQRLFNDESPGSLRDRITKKLQEARRVPFLWDQLRKSMSRIEHFNVDVLIAAIEHEAALAKGAKGRQRPE